MTGLRMEKFKGEGSSKVLKVGHGGDLTMTAESRRRKAVPP